MGVNRFVELDGNGVAIRPAPSTVVARLEPARGLMWGPTLPGEMNFEQAQKACAEFRLFGFTDWRLPTVEELFLLADRTRYNPAIDTDAFPDTKSAYYWASSPWASSPGSYAWLVGFGGGGASGNRHGDECFVRPVRSVAAPGQ